MTSKEPHQCPRGGTRPAALARTAGVLTATTAPAAAVACNYDGSTFNVCITINYAGNGVWNISVGYDAYMSQAHADRILAHGSGMFAQLWGDDGGPPA
jgi:hypothetical protein